MMRIGGIMGFISGFGTKFAVRTLVLAASATMLMGTSQLNTLDVQVSGLRSTKGLVQVCLTARADKFPGCKGDPQARRLSVAAKDAGAFSFRDLPAGNYAMALIHDENSNEKLDTTLGIPREGFGFSMNPAIRFGAPSFKDAHFTVAAGETNQRVKMKYLL
jgi:uncharacterized protein (DUF2141 family)